MERLRLGYLAEDHQKNISYYMPLRKYDKRRRVLRSVLTGALFLSIVGIGHTKQTPQTPTVTSPPPLNLGTRRELFVDDYLIDRMSGATLRLHTPTPHEVAIVHDAPWEGNVSTYHALLTDDGVLRMYYRGAHYDEATKKETHPEVVCYAESRDGIHWVKPDLGLYEFKGSKKNNIVWRGKNGGGGHNFAPFKDTNPACRPEERYKALLYGVIDRHAVLYALTSPDGLHWKQWGETPVLTEGRFDSLNTAFYDAERKRYVAFFRDYRKDVREIVTATSADFRTWTKPEFLTYPGVPTEQLYTNAIIAYPRAPQLFVGFPKRFVPDRNPTNHASSGVSDGVFMSSRDGRTFRRWTEAFLRPGPQPSHWVNRNNLIAWGIAETKSDLPGAPNELSLYATEDYYRGPSCKLRRYTVRLDGFVSVNAPLSGGEFVTKPFTFTGRELTLNYATSAAGSVQIEVQDANGTPIPGFTLAETPILFGDSLEQVVRWKDGAQLTALAGKSIRLRFVLKDADLYSLRFQ